MQGIQSSPAGLFTLLSANLAGQHIHEAMALILNASRQHYISSPTTRQGERGSKPSPFTTYTVLYLFDTDIEKSNTST